MPEGERAKIKEEGITVRHRDLETILYGVEKPSRYIGGEWNAIRKDPDEAELKFALCFPDLYEIGMSHLGFKILYSLLNSQKHFLAERVFTPWIDMQKEMKKREIPLFSLENRIPLNEFDIVGFSLQYELNYTNVLAMLDLGLIPLRSDHRDESSPLVVAGGPAAFNPEPLSAFIDLFLIGDGEESVLELARLSLKLRKEGAGRREMISAASHLPGVYAPSLYREVLRVGFSHSEPIGDAPFPVKKRIVHDLEASPFPEEVIVPHCQIVHDRISFEIMRGCLTGCRFCQAGYIYRPKRDRDPLIVRDAVKRSIISTGYEEASLTSLNTGEYDGIHSLLSSLMRDFAGDSTSLSLPSLKPSSLTEEIVREIKKVRKTGFTIAPEAATDRLRAVINKDINEEHIMNAADAAFREGWRLLKLYFMIGLPTETDDDVEAIVALVKRIVKRVRKAAGSKGQMNVSLSSFVPKPHTPFQWLSMERIEELERRQRFVKDRLSSNFIRIKWHNTRMSYMEAVFSRGDRRLNDVVEDAYRRGCSFDGWTDRFDFSKWMQSFESTGIDPSEYAYRNVNPHGELPWDIIDTGISKSFLREELEKALRAEMTPQCRLDCCHGCAGFVEECVKNMKKRRSPIVGAETQERPDNEALSVARSERGYRYRAQYEKRGVMRFLSHLDMSRAIIRGMRRARIILLHSRGFNPLPRIAFGPALPVGTESLSEYIDFYSKEYIHEERFPEMLNAFLPDGLSFRMIKSIAHDAPSLSQSLICALYSVRCEEPVERERMLQMVAGLIAIREKKEPQREGVSLPAEVADAIKDIYCEGEDTVKILLTIAGPGRGRISDILKVLSGSERPNVKIVREEMFVEKDGKLCSPFLLNSIGKKYVERNNR